MTDDERARRGGWLWLWVALFVIAVLVVLFWAWPAREPPATGPAGGGAAAVEATDPAPPGRDQTWTVSSITVSAARFERV